MAGFGKWWIGPTPAPLFILNVKSFKALGSIDLPNVSAGE